MNVAPMQSPCCSHVGSGAVTGLCGLRVKRPCADSLLALDEIILTCVAELQVQESNQGLGRMHLSAVRTIK